MNTDRDELIDAMAAVTEFSLEYDELPPLLDALLAHPGAVLRELENAKCETCGGTGVTGERVQVARSRHVLHCPACGGSGILGRDGVLRALGMERSVDPLTSVWANERGEPNGDYPPVTVSRIVQPAYVWRVAVPEPSEGEK